MKKNDYAHKKSSTIYNANKSQKKISSFFIKAPKVEVREDKNINVFNHKLGIPTLNRETQKKRKLSEEMYPDNTSLKITKNDGMHDVKHQNTMQSQDRDRHKNVSQCDISGKEEKKINKSILSQCDNKQSIYSDTVDVDKKVTLIKKSSNCKENKKSLELTTNAENTKSKNVIIPKPDVPCSDSTFSLETAHVRSNNICTTKDLQRLNIDSKNPKLSEHLVEKSEDIEELSKSDDFDINGAFEPCIMDEYEDIFSEEWNRSTEIDLSNFQRCKIINVDREDKVMQVTVQHIDSKSIATVSCSGFWMNTPIEKDDIVTIQARQDAQHWIIDNNTGFLVIKPDTLISSTTVVGSLFCNRRAVLSQMFSKIEALPYYKGDSSSMAIGILVHQLFQQALSANVNTLSNVIKLMDDMLHSRDTANLLYAAEISTNVCQQQMHPYALKIFEFIQYYIKGKKQQSITDLRQKFDGKITQVNDIEENIWLPNLGIKGKIDVTVEVNIHARQKVVPLEVKTGRTSFSAEHKGQIILYIMMMALTSRDTDSGLLLYLKDNSMQEIRSGHPEKRDLILLRNTLAHYFTQKSTETEQNLLNLPEPINHHSACSKCPYNTLCSVYLSKDVETKLSDSNPLKTIAKKILEKLKPSHIDYVLKWISLLQMEDAMQTDESTLKDIWTLAAEKREERGTCISNLKVLGKVTEKDSKFQHMFVRKSPNDRGKDFCIDFSENDYVVVSMNMRVNISTGFVIDVKEDSIVVNLNKDITKIYVDDIFHIDKYSSFRSSSYNLANVAGLLADDEIYTKLRDIIIDRKPATFVKKLPHKVICTSSRIMKDLNKNQQRAVLKALAANDYVLVKGMPGTGKTQTLIALIKLVHKLGLSVLITAHTHNAVDNILLKLLNDGIDFIRLGSIFSVHPLIKSKTEECLTANCHSPESLETVYNSKSIVGVTCFGAHHTLLEKRTFDICIVDESAQTMQPTILRPLYSARKFVLAGDPDQLPPIVRNTTARKLGAEESLFARLDSENNTVELISQYRMNKSIMKIANQLTYRDKLQPGNTLVENATFSAPYNKVLDTKDKWIRRILCQEIDKSVMILDTGPTGKLKVNNVIDKKYSNSDQIYSNIWEAGIILQLLQTLLEMGVDPVNIGIIAPYRAHVILIQKLVPRGIEVNTVDQYQGRDKEIIFYSCSRSLAMMTDKKKDFEILEDHRRLTVATTRAKHKLIIIMDKDTIIQYTPFKKLFDLVKEENTVELVDGDSDFAWNTIASIL
ncbi:hypothetical protein KM043_009514 [Ampulex compressa]|nr:hypothetical protein KM043_009514 [Ampulex compressa]